MTGTHTLLKKALSAIEAVHKAFGALGCVVMSDGMERGHAAMTDETQRLLTAAMHALRSYKKAAGALLDGREHREFPE